MAHHRRVKGAGEGEDKPCFQGPALQPTHHCHRACSCLGPEHRRLIKAPCRFSPLITLARRLRAGKRKGCGLRYLPPGPRGSLALASFPPPSVKKINPTHEETRAEASPEPHGRSRPRRLAPAGPPRRRGNTAAPAPLPGEGRTEPRPRRLAQISWLERKLTGSHRC